MSGHATPIDVNYESWKAALAGELPIGTDVGCGFRLGYVNKDKDDSSVAYLSRDDRSGDGRIDRIVLWEGLSPGSLGATEGTVMRGNSDYDKCLKALGDMGKVA